jgi:y4mF family transcriptional regulator
MIGAFVRMKRRELGLTQQELATQAGVGLNFVYQLESGKETVQLDCVVKVLQALGHRLEAVPVDAAPLGFAGPRPLRQPARLPWD